MARLSGSLITHDDVFRHELTALLRSAAVPVHVASEATAWGNERPDIALVDARLDVPGAIVTVERLRASDASIGIFFIASESHPDAILRAMRAGANEFFPWPPSRESLDEAVHRADARRAQSPSVASQATTTAFFGAKGGAGTTTVAVNFGVEVARLSKQPTVIVDLKPGLGEVALFLGVRSRYTLADALDNLHRLDGEFLKELVFKHKSGLEILAGSEVFERPAVGDGPALEDVFRLLGRQYAHVIIDAGSHLNACAIAGLYAADTVCMVANPDVPSVRNAQRLLVRMGQIGPCGERVRVLLNRAAEPYPIPPAQIESALGHPIFHTFPSDYKTVSTALNSGVPLSAVNNPEMAAQFDRFTRRLLGSDVETRTTAPRTTLGLQRFASLW